MGFIGKVFPTKETAVAAAVETAKLIASKSPVGVQGTKNVLLYSWVWIGLNLSSVQADCSSCFTLPPRFPVGTISFSIQPRPLGRRRKPLRRKLERLCPADRGSFKGDDVVAEKDQGHLSQSLNVSFRESL